MSSLGVSDANIGLESVHRRDGNCHGLIMRGSRQFDELTPDPTLLAFLDSCGEEAGSHSQGLAIDRQLLRWITMAASDNARRQR